MIDNKPQPGVSRTERLTLQGLERLDKQLARGVNVSTAVLAQWIRRYGDAARLIIKKHKRYRAEFDRIR